MKKKLCVEEELLKTKRSEAKKRNGEEACWRRRRLKKIENSLFFKQRGRRRRRRRSICRTGGGGWNRWRKACWSGVVKKNGDEIWRWNRSEEEASNWWKRKRRKWNILMKKMKWRRKYENGGKSIGSCRAQFCEAWHRKKTKICSNEDGLAMKRRGTCGGQRSEAEEPGAKKKPSSGVKAKKEKGLASASAKRHEGWNSQAAWKLKIRGKWSERKKKKIMK